MHKIFWMQKLKIRIKQKRVEETIFCDNNFVVDDSIRLKFDN